ncbi:hypothetical protein C3F09_01150 [candidate division GN15 bacterium]|uniref:Nal1 C-terminal domain-containing protein n=1 Tax=candidate division GN15 bacterium TaxID=2072418 RepID=A0A855XBA5_9BACT|nr:MAG: hypothetical protein C3F09_01150 [candidate division GN15 bacterium]
MSEFLSPKETGGGDDSLEGRFDDIELPEGTEEGPGEAMDDSQAEAQRGDISQRLLDAQAELEEKLILSVVDQAMAAESGTDSYGFENVLGVGIGEKSTGGRATGQQCVVVYVMSKASDQQIHPEALVPTEVNGVATDVIATGEIQALSFRGRYRPAPGGVSIAHVAVTAGTLGCLVYRARLLYVLSNNHVLANCNRARMGDLIVQPGPYDGGRAPRDVIARLSQFIPINFSGQPNEVDCAIAQTSPRLVRPQNISYGRIGSMITAGRIGLPVKKAGRTTQLTKGRITGLHATIRVGYGTPGTAIFTDQLVIQSTTKLPFSAGGDSGSLIVTDMTANNPVGLLFAGSATHTIANSIKTVLGRLNVRILS